MARNPTQEAALQRKYSAKRDETRAAFEQALETLAADPEAALTERALYEAAGRSRATLNRYPDLKVQLAALRASRSEGPSGRVGQAQAAGKESTTAKKLRQALVERDAMAQRVAILSLAIQDLQRRYGALVRLHSPEVGIYDN